MTSPHKASYLLARDGPIAYYRVVRDDGEHYQTARVLSNDVNHPASRLLDHEFDLRSRIDAVCAMRPTVRECTPSGTVLRYDDEPGTALDILQWRTLTIENVLARMAAIARALSLLHGCGLIHRNIKPANIFIAEDGSCRFRGFGVAALTDADSPLSVISLHVGNRDYAAPEVTQPGPYLIDARADLYSLGVIVHALLVGTDADTVGSTRADTETNSAAHNLGVVIGLEPLAPIMCIVHKLTSLHPASRYQTATGLHADLRRCLAAYRATGVIVPFALGMQDGGNHLVYSNTLYARDDALAQLFTAHDQARVMGRPQLAVVSGATGIGKSALADEFTRQLALTKQLVAVGKADQFRRDIPYAALTEAFAFAARAIQACPPEAQQIWRERIANALGTFAGLALKVVPELEGIICDAVETAQFPVQQAEARLLQVFEALLRAFTQPGMPLVLILDDAHWLDEATHRLLYSLATGTPPHAWLLVLILRDDAIVTDKDLRYSIGKLRVAMRGEADLTLTGLDQADLSALIGESVAVTIDDLPALSQFVLDRTQGNPFLVRTLLSAINDDGDITRSHHSGLSHLDVAQIRSRHFGGDILHVIDARIKRMPESTRRLLAAMAWLGGPAALELLSETEQLNIAQVGTEMERAADAGLVRLAGQHYVFVHDQIQRAAYNTLGVEARLLFHKRVGLLLAAESERTGRDDTLFLATDHLLRARTLLDTPEERTRLGQTVLQAAGHAKRAIAYATAIDYLDTVLAHFMPTECTVFNRLLFALDLERAECEFHRGHLVTATQHLRRLLRHAYADVQQAAVYRLMAEVQFRRFDIDAGIASALQGLAALDIVIPPYPTEAECFKNYERVATRLPVSALETLSDLPTLNDPRITEAMNLLCTLLSPSGMIQSRLQFTVTCVALRLTFDFGLSGPATTALAWFGALFAHKLDQYESGYLYARTAQRLGRAHGYTALDAKNLLPMAQVSVWTRPLGEAIDTARQAFAVAVANGDEAIASVACHHIVAMQLAQGVHLERVWREVEHGLAFVEKAGFTEVRAILNDQQRFVANLRGRFDADYAVDDIDPYDARYPHGVASATTSRAPAGRLAASQFNRHLFQGMTHLLHGQLEQALSALDRAAHYAWSAPAHLPLFALELFGLLATAASCGDRPPAIEQAEKMRDHYEKLARWAHANPCTFEDKHLLATAEIQRTQGEHSAALATYERAARASDRNEFPHYAALAYERAASLCDTLGYNIARIAYLRDARENFSKWGAMGKVRLIDQQLPDGQRLVSSVTPVASAALTLPGPDGIAGLLEAARALSEEVVLEKLIEKLLSIALTLANASVGVLVRVIDGVARVEASARAHPLLESPEVTMLSVVPTSELLPMSMLNTALRTQRRVVVGTAASTRPVIYDDYLRRKPGCTAVCLPLLKRNKLVGALYLESSDTQTAMTPGQASVLELLAAQAAISLETARFYAELMEENAQRRKVEHALRLGESSLAMAEQISHTGSWRWDLRSNELTCSEEYRRIFGLDPRRTHLPFAQYMACVHPDDQKNLEEIMRQALETRSTMRAEYRIVKPDGSIRYISGIGKLASHRGDHLEYIGTVADITRQREADEALRTAQADLARVARANTVGQLTASIAHELNQPLTSIISNAGASLRWMDRPQPNLEAVRDGIKDIALEGQRAGEMISGLLSLTRNAPRHFAPLDVHEAARHILKLSRRDMEQKGIRLELALTASQSVVNGDAVQLQQVLLNLVLNAFDAMGDVTDRARVLRVTSQNINPATLVVCVEDNGMGVAAEHLPRLFEPFYTTKAAGMGMGLAICRSIINAHHGSLAVHQRDPQGTSFCMSLNLHIESTP